MYDGPGMYRHWKGGHYLVLGLGADEGTSRDFVIYVSMDPDHQMTLMASGTQFVLRPLTERDKSAVMNDQERAFNEPVPVHQVQAYRKQHYTEFGTAQDHKPHQRFTKVV